MKNIKIIFFLLSFVKAEAQNFGTSLGCNINVNDPIISMGTWRPSVDATFKYSRPNTNGIDGQFGTSCKGTLINRKTSDGSLGFYFVTARHCFIDGNEPKHNFNNDYYFYFSYQSKNQNNASTAISNYGTRVGSQTNLHNIDPDDNSDYHYGHRSKIRVVADFQWGDFILCEILTPLPPHFDVTYAGWNPSPFRTPLSGPFRGVHHPRGDIKKASLALNMYWLKNPIASGCYSITKLIDVLFGGIWGRRWSTSVICKYVEVPYFYVNWGWAVQKEAHRVLVCFKEMEN